MPQTQPQWQTGESQDFPYNFSYIASSLEADGEEAIAPLGWLEESYRSPGGFWRALCRHHSTVYPPAIKSRHAERFDLYHDLVLRHLPLNGMTCSLRNLLSSLRLCAFARETQYSNGVPPLTHSSVSTFSAVV